MPALLKRTLSTFIDDSQGTPSSFQEAPSKVRKTNHSQNSHDSPLQRPFWKNVSLLLGLAETNTYDNSNKANKAVHKNNKHSSAQPLTYRHSQDSFASDSSDVVITGFKPATPLHRILGQPYPSNTSLSPSHTPSLASSYTRKPPMFAREWNQRIRSEDQKRLEELRQRQQNDYTDAKRNGFFRGDLQAWKDSNAFRQRIYQLSSASLRRENLDPKQRLKQQADLERILQNAKKSYNLPKIEKPSLDEFNRLTIRDKEIDKAIRDSKKSKGRKFKTELSDDMQAQVSAIFADRSFKSNLTDSEVLNKDIVLLKPATWLNDESINFYGKLITVRSEEYAKSNPDLIAKQKGKFLKTYAFKSFFYENLNTRGYDSVKRWSRRFDFFAQDIIIVPVNIYNSHWTCAAINLSRKRFEYYDSLGSKGAGVLQKLRDYLQAEAKKNKRTIDLNEWEDYSPDEYPQQENANDCGVFTIMAMEYLSRRDWLFDWTQDNMPYLRGKIVLDIADCKINPEDGEDNQ